jgi:hypothetical protein
MLSGTNGLINAYGVVIRWQSTDFSNAPATAVATTTGAAAEATHDSSGLTAGADVGIGIGAAVAVILFVAVGVFLLRRHNRRGVALGMQRSEIRTWFFPDIQAGCKWKPSCQ